jgi:methionyl-tRNA formyltransferase
MSLRIVLVGQEAAGAQLLRALSGAEHEVVACLTQEPDKRGGSASLAALATRLGIGVLPAALVRDASFASQLRDWRIDLLLNVHSLHVVADAVLEAPRIGSFNLHPGPLPEYAGLNTVGWAIYNADTTYGVTLHWMKPRIDAGPIAFLDRFPVSSSATSLTLSAECTQRGLALIAALLEQADRDPSSIPARPQDLGSRRYFARKDAPQRGRVDWRSTGAEIDRLGRAFDYGPFACPWGRLRADLDGESCDVSQLRRTDEPADAPPGTPRVERGSLWVSAADEWIDLGNDPRTGMKTN